jgi:hypothetical protein
MPKDLKTSLKLLISGDFSKTPSPYNWTTDYSINRVPLSSSALEMKIAEQFYYLLTTTVLNSPKNLYKFGYFFI